MTFCGRVPIFYLFDPDSKLITLCDTGGAPVRVNDQIFQDRLGASDNNADDVARALFLRSHGKRPDDFPISYPDLGLP